jgi:hypothetical protein
MKRREIAIVILIVLGILVLAFLLRHVATPPDCISDPQNPACQERP